MYLGPGAGEPGASYRPDVLAHEVAHVIQGSPLIRRYFDEWPASDNAVEIRRKARFDTFVDNAVAAGISVDIAEASGRIPFNAGMVGPAITPTISTTAGSTAPKICVPC